MLLLQEMVLGVRVPTVGQTNLFKNIFSFEKTMLKKPNWMSPRSIVDKVLDCEFQVSEFELQ